MKTTTPAVWVVDDDEDDQNFIRSAFGTGYPAISVMALNDGSELLPKLDECADLPRLILLDINMPLKNGFETLEELREVPKFADIPVVMLTTSSDEKDRARCIRLGANRFITKPLTYAQLTPMVEMLIQEWSLA